MYELSYNYVKPQYEKKIKIVLNRYRHWFFIVYIKIDNIYQDIADDVESRFDTSSSELDRPLTKGKG